MARQTQSNPLDQLTERERAVLDLLRSGLGNSEIAERLGISLDGAKYHVSEIIGKLGVRSRHEAAYWPERPPWWLRAVAPLGMGWQKAGASWLSGAVAAGLAIALVAGIGLLVWGLVRTDGDGGPSVPEGLGYVTFEAGETITADGPGIYFVDPETGVSEGWFAPDRDVLGFEIFGVSADGRIVLYTCRERQDTRIVPCGESDQDAIPTFYLLNTQTGERIELAAETRYVSLSPDGGTILAHRDGRVGLATADSAAPLRLIEPVLTIEPSLSGLAPEWSPDGSAVLLNGNAGTTLVDVDSAQAIELVPGRAAGSAWSPDGSAIAVSQPVEEKAPDTPSGTFVFDADGDLLWESPVSGFTSNPQWSPDGRQLAVQVDAPPPGAGSVRYFRLDVFDGGTGEELYRIDSAIACQGSMWTADSRRLVIASQEDFQFSLLADPAAGTLERFDSGVVASPFDGNGGFELSFDGDDERNFYRTDLSTGERTLLARTTADAAWHGGLGHHVPLFSDDRIMFTSPHGGGHGGCAEGGWPDEPRELAFQYPPFDE